MGGKKYINAQGVEFNIEIEKEEIPDWEDYFSYYLDITAVSDRAHTLMYKAIITKELCPTEVLADMWVKTTVLNFLTGRILETYEDGRCHSVAPPSKQWSII